MSVWRCASWRPRFLFEVPLYGSLLVLVGESMLYMLVALGIGLFISSVTKNQFVASQLALLTSFCRH